MKLRLLISLSLALLAGRTVRAQTADDFFHGGAQSYLTNNVQNALTQTEAGLKLYPDDVKLKKLYELLKQQQQSQSQSQQDQQQKQNQEDQKSDSEKQENQKQNQEQQKQDEQQKQAPAQSRDQNKKDERQSGQPQTQPGEMTPQQAKRLLDSQKEDEKVLPPRPDQNSSPRQRTLRDW